jgi:hypothetical protein
MVDGEAIDDGLSALRQDLGQEYYAILGVVSDYDGRLVTIKSWSVTLSLALLGLGFQQGHYALFGLASVTALAFWYLDALYKGYQMRYYPRMRDIEVAAYRINHVELGPLGRVSAPQIDMSWGYSGRRSEGDWRSDKPERRTAAEVRTMLRRRAVYPHVMLPHAVAVLLGLALFVAAANNVWGLATLNP